MNSPFKIHPYDDLVSKGCPWIDEVKTRVLRRIDEFKDFITKEAASDGIPYFAEEDFVYERFVDNREHDLKGANLEVMKYFVLFFNMKILYDMIGEWKFTERDAEMYDYFRTADFAKVKTAPFFYKFDKDMTPPSVFVNDKSCKWFIVLDGEEEFYTNLFYKEIILLNDMVRNVRKCTPLKPEDMFFSGAVLHEGLNLRTPVDYSTFTERNFK